MSPTATQRALYPVLPLLPLLVLMTQKKIRNVLSFTPGRIQTAELFQFLKCFDWGKKKLKTEIKTFWGKKNIYLRICNLLYLEAGFNGGGGGILFYLSINIASMIS